MRNVNRREKEFVDQIFTFDGDIYGPPYLLAGHMVLLGVTVRIKTAKIVKCIAEGSPELKHINI